MPPCSHNPGYATAEALKTEMRITALWNYNQFLIATSKLTADYFFVPVIMYVHIPYNSNSTSAENPFHYPMHTYIITQCLNCCGLNC